MKTENITVIIVGAGTGSRFGASRPKQYCDYGGRPLLMTSVERVREALPGARIVLVLARDWVEAWSEMCTAHGFDSPDIVTGGASRWQSVRNAIDSLPADYRGIIMVHDAARPLLSPAVAGRLLSAIEAGASGAVPVLEMADSIRRRLPGGASEAVDRSLFVRIQTPQAFDAAKLRQAYSLPYNSTMTDDASVMEAAGFGAPALVAGDEVLMKVTSPGDMDILRIYHK
ncbi:MAG TPA: 2-C-methyl-D-erythritol 4-phosphate cytidylyltransferase [Porphyromonadaceae bacterium]|nr:2-C-methyl-D-erythritol 4-phosphate cytidylyltransferase [Paramuribaculum sp.]HAB40867.1 2-C-methyl-D-erythritol 4-phosphate cytidylyltransferase [Porphyromonadaceae bacterium]